MVYDADPSERSDVEATLAVPHQTMLAQLMPVANELRVLRIEAGAAASGAPAKTPAVDADTVLDALASTSAVLHCVVGRAAQGCQRTLAYLASRGFSPTNVKHGHPAATLLAKYAEAAGTSALTQTATATLQHADATFAKLALHAASYEATEARDDVAQVKAATKPNPRSVNGRSIPMNCGNQVGG